MVVCEDNSDCDDFVVDRCCCEFGCLSECDEDDVMDGVFDFDVVCRIRES